MKTRKTRRERRLSPLFSKKYWLVLTSLFLVTAAVVVWMGKERPASAPASFQQNEQPAAAVQGLQEAKPPAPRQALEFHMIDMEHGWIQYADQKEKTEDGGQHWEVTDAAYPSTLIGDATTTAGFLAAGEQPLLVQVSFNSKSYLVKQSQFLTKRIGWVLVEGDANLKVPLLVTPDGGQTWSDQLTPAIQTAMQDEKGRLLQWSKESALYTTAAAAKAVMDAAWSLIPSTSAPGDVVLVRHNEPGQVEWLGKTYKLQPFGAGYFTYLPITMQAKPGKYTIGDQTLTIQAKKFETQYLQVTEQMESMKQDTARINADQKKIDLARSHSEPEFLFKEAFVQPIEGILTTPYGYTRYVNGKYDSSHMAVDLAAKEGTPIKATNDGVVALAEPLYLTGNSIYIDHGMGLFSQYAHLSKLNVKAGDRVKKGDNIGLVGTTGFSTGPHLHFTFWAHNVQVNPNLFFNTTPFHWLKEKA
ncbi:M23 family metallopeptidase [Paenibacillus aestuarii]|uniref:M23 family metallopeptidase n=1 Tax=Paenibacillus aestuarii TaxID=516965 RepID=A0ABW0KDE3_9BACL|nr:M23 family metallopeptidase [Paenibacillus aestuarii]